jgi:hypothetical protein
MQKIMEKEGGNVVYKQIQELCRKDGIKITQLERILKFGNGTIHNWDTRDPSLKKVVEVVEHFGIGLDDLVSCNIPSKESRQLAAQIERYSAEQKNLIKCYMSLIERGEQKSLSEKLFIGEGA